MNEGVFGEWRDCITCGRPFDANSPRYSPGAMECWTCVRFGPPPKEEE